MRQLPSVNFEGVFLSNRPLIERTTSAICRRHCLSRPESDDFMSTVHLHLINDDYAVLRAFRGQSSLETYLAAVIRQLFQDWRNARWGRWRPSAAARRLGPVAVLLETFIMRDKLTLDEAMETLRVNHGVGESTAELRALAAAFPARGRPVVVTDDDLDRHPSAGERADALVERAATAGETARVRAVLDRALSELPAQDQVILRLRFEGDATMSLIGRTLGLDPRQLYRRVDRVLVSLRRALEAAGVTETDALQVLADRGFAPREDAS